MSLCKESLCVTIFASRKTHILCLVPRLVPVPVSPLHLIKPIHLCLFLNHWIPVAPGFNTMFGFNLFVPLSVPLSVLKSSWNVKVPF